MRAERKDLGQLRVSEAGSGSESLPPFVIFTSLDAVRCPR